MKTAQINLYTKNISAKAKTQSIKATSAQNSDTNLTDLPNFKLSFGMAAEFRYNCTKFIKKYLSKDGTGSICAHFASAKKLREMNETFKTRPDILATIYLTQNMFGDLPVHLADTEKIEAIHEGLKNQPETLCQMYLTENENFDLPVDNPDKKAVETILRKVLEIATSTNGLKETKLRLLKTYKHAADKFNAQTENETEKIPFDAAIKGLKA